MPFSNSALSYVKRAAGVLGVVTVTLIGQNVALKIVGTTPRGNIFGGSGSVLLVLASTGSQVLQVNSSGALISSGNLIIGHANTGCGKTLIMGNDGGGVCINDQDGTGCSCFDGNNGVLFGHVGSTAECAAETYR